MRRRDSRRCAQQYRSRQQDRPDGRTPLRALPGVGLVHQCWVPLQPPRDLSETSVLLSADPDPAELEAFLAIMARTGASTGAPATALRVLRAGKRQPWPAGTS
uniref:Cyclic di-GMP-binding protein n=1 Tax=Phenylobacterium glaciei TaxID=2803784 RepID=A0A974S994_9CAUL|nr:cellulose biosynthesis cyclic di-GMP-binding regulatory protein BcsB [Phenylobacterium glaciei]